MGWVEGTDEIGVSPKQQLLLGVHFLPLTIEFWEEVKKKKEARTECESCRERIKINKKTLSKQPSTKQRKVGVGERADGSNTQRNVIHRHY